jgi:hypothetical protein
MTETVVEKPLQKYCFHGQHSKPVEGFRTLPGSKQRRQVCADCYKKILTERKARAR